MFLCCYPYGITILRVLDDIIISRINLDSILRLHDSLQALFHMKDLGPFTYFLGVKVYKSNNGLFINQQKYTLRPYCTDSITRLSSYGHSLRAQCVVLTRWWKSSSLSHNIRKLDGSLVYLTITRSDISHVVNIVKHFMTKPQHLHLAPIERIIR